MRLWVKGIGLDQLSSVRGIGKYSEMILEAINQYGKEKEIFLDQTNYEILLHPGFSPFQIVNPEKNKVNVLVIHDLIPLKYPEHFPIGWKGKLIWQQNQRLLKQFQGFITDTEYVKNEIQKILKVKSEKVYVVPAAAKKLYEQNIKLESFKLNKSVPKNYVLYVGDVNWNKNLVNLGKAIKKTNLSLVLVGKALKDKSNLNHPWQKDFKQFIDLVQEDKKFIFLGYVPDQDLLGLYQHARLLLMPSYDEGFGLPWLEASLSKTAVVLGENPVLQEIAGEAAYYAKPDQAESIVEAVNQAQNKSDKKLQEKQENRVKIYSQKRFVHNLSRSLKSLLND